jgi:hypothetical protein
MSKRDALDMRVGTKHQDTASQEPVLQRWAETHEGECRWNHDAYTHTSTSSSCA